MRTTIEKVAFDAMQVPDYTGTTKSDLLAMMDDLGACDGATTWVEEQHATDAHTIVLDCTRLDWISWFVGECGDRPDNAPAWMIAIYDRHAAEGGA